MKPARASSVSSTGSWKQMPKPRISVMISERYSLTRAVSWMCTWLSPVCCIDRKNFMASGMATK